MVVKWVAKKLNIYAKMVATVWYNGKRQKMMKILLIVIVLEHLIMANIVMKVYFINYEKLSIIITNIENEIKYFDQIIVILFFFS